MSMLRGFHPLPPFTAARRSRLWLAAGVVLLLAVGCGGEAPSDEATPGQPVEERAVTVETVVVQPETAVEILDLPADLGPDRRAVLAAEVPGTVESLEVEEGQRVAAGKLLATVDIRALEQAVAEARAVFERASDEHRRAEALFEKRSVTRSDLVAAQSERDVAKARLASAELNLDKSRLEAPWGGMVSATRVEVGDYVVPGQAMVELVDVDPLKVRAPVPAADVPFVQVGEPVTIRVSSFPGEELTGTVVRLAAELDEAARTLGLEAEIANPEGRLRPGMLARVQIPRRTIEGALLVPIQALIDLEDRQVVYVVEGDGDAAHAERRTVQLGATIGERIVVEQGLASGDRVIVRGQSRVAPGQKVDEASATQAPAAGPAVPADEPPAAPDGDVP